MVKIVFAFAATLHFWERVSQRNKESCESFELARIVARRREIERHPESVTGGRSEWERRH